MLLGGGACLYTNYISHFTGYILPWVVYNELCLAIMIVPVYLLWRRCSPHLQEREHIEEAIYQQISIYQHYCISLYVYDQSETIQTAD